MIDLGDGHMEALAPGQVLFRVHSPHSLESEMVSADVFARKLAALVAALKAADAAMNGSVQHDYKIAKLKSSSPTVILSETSAPTGVGKGNQSGVVGFRDCADAVISGDRERAFRYGRCVNYVSTLAKGANKKFGYGEIWTDQKDAIRVDPFLVERAQAIIHPQKEKKAADITPTWFKGVAFGSFDGKLLEVDLRGALPEITLVLSAGGEQIDCVCRVEDIETIRRALNNRVRVAGRAIYDGKGGLPRRVEVSEIQSVEDGDLTKWRGAFEPFEPSDWESDEA